jgi:hypothetical protein
LRELYFKLTNREIKIDVASKLILRIGDNEVTISQLSLKTTQEILFLPFKEIEKDGNDYFGYSYANSPKERKRKITDLTLVITGAVSKLDTSVSAQNIALSQIIKKVKLNCMANVVNCKIKTNIYQYRPSMELMRNL